MFLMGPSCSPLLAGARDLAARMIGVCTYLALEECSLTTWNLISSQRVSSRTALHSLLEVKATGGRKTPYLILSRVLLDLPWGVK